MITVLECVGEVGPASVAEILARTDTHRARGIHIGIW